MSYRYAGTQWQRATLKALFMTGVFESLEGSFLHAHAHIYIYIYTCTVARAYTRLWILKSSVPALHVYIYIFFPFPRNFTFYIYIYNNTEQCKVSLLISLSTKRSSVVFVSPPVPSRRSSVIFYTRKAFYAVLVLFFFFPVPCPRK